MIEPTKSSNKFQNLTFLCIPTEKGKLMTQLNKSRVQILNEKRLNSEKGKLKL